MSFQVKLAFEGLIDRFDGLPQRLEQRCTRPFGLTLASRAQQAQTRLGQCRFELAAEIVLVADQCLSWPAGGQGGVGVEDLQQGLALVGFRAGQREPDRQSTQRADQVQAQAPEVA